MRQDRKDSLKSQVSSLKPSHFTLHTSRSHVGGFTFVELLVTMVLISIVMPVVMQTIGLCTRLAGQSRRQVEAACLAETKLTELTAAQDWESGSNRGDFGTDWPGYEWSMTVANWTEDSSVRQLDLAVTWRSVGRQRKITLSTLVYPQES
ncbi:MAG: prepilin-type N-terminal cleavage/methylation domain-containing protein [Phycisphaerae bacterium]|nr:prepilin-type N-terminal cleavage/methylation domain-containing protein [Phycisphaerae bacterium]